MAHLVIGSLRSNEFAAATRDLSPGLDVRVWPEMGRIEDITTALAWGPPPGVLKTLPNLRLIVSVGAGVDHLFRDPELPRSVPIVRYVDPDLTNRMVQYVALHVLWHHRRMSEFLAQQREKVWKYLPEPAPHETRVGIMGLGRMGAASARALVHLGFQVRAWTRTPHTMEGVTCLAGPEGLAPFLAETDILACVLPLTPATRGILDGKLISGMSTKGRHPRLPGPALINAGRGPLQVEADILAALNSGALYAASLDVFEQEPLPAESPLWLHPRVVITPHNAAESEAYSICRYMLRQMKAEADGRPLENVVDPRRQY